MGIALFSTAGLFASLQGMVDWLAPSAQRVPSLFAEHGSRRPASHRRNHGRTNEVAAASPASRLSAPRPALRAARAICVTRPLRVVRVAEASASGSAGRMVISGRMADVCAELDRLAALEARANGLPARG